MLSFSFSKSVRNGGTHPVALKSKKSLNDRKVKIDLLDLDIYGVTSCDIFTLRRRQVPT